jgi:hypothetical protein
MNPMPYAMIGGRGTRLAVWLFGLLGVFGNSIFSAAADRMPRDPSRAGAGPVGLTRDVDARESGQDELFCRSLASHRSWSSDQRMLMSQAETGRMRVWSRRILEMVLGDQGLAGFQAKVQAEEDAKPASETVDEASLVSNAELDEAAHDALAAMPWYDSRTGQVQPLPVQPPRDLQNRFSEWEGRPDATWNWDWSRMPDFSSVLSVLGWLALLTVILLVAYFLVRALIDSEWLGGRSATWVEQNLEGELDRVEALPIQLKRPRGDLLAEAQRHYEAGEWAEAMIYLYSYQLLQLDKNQWIRLTRGKTNRQYWRELSRNQGPAELMSQSIVAFEDVFFGRHPLDRQRFEACWNRLDEFHSAVSREPANV